MCQAIIRYCSDSARPILISGSILTLLAALGIGYVSYTSNALYEELDKSITQNKLSTAYYLQLLAVGYLILVAVLASLAANYDQKYSIRALSIISSINFMLAVVAIVLIVPADQPSKLFESKLLGAINTYDYRTNYTDPHNNTKTDSGSPATAAKNVTSVENLTILLDDLQKRGCCGFNNATTEYKGKIAKSCCEPAKIDQNPANEYVCSRVDDGHKQTCSNLINSTRINLEIVLALAALANLYLAFVSGIRAYKTLPYVEASQNAYS